MQSEIFFICFAGIAVAALTIFALTRPSRDNDLDWRDRKQRGSNDNSRTQ